MDKTKRRIAFGICGAAFGLAGAIAISISATLALAELIGMIYATLAVSAAYIALALISAFIFLRPSKTTTEEVGSIESATAEALADLPFDTIEAIIKKRPLAALGIALAVGYVGARDPEGAMKSAQNMFSKLF